jgi:hypothetical protein
VKVRFVVLFLVCLSVTSLIAKNESRQSSRSSAHPPVEAPAAHAPVDAAASSAPGEIPTKLRNEYFAQRPNSFLIDPQKLLSRTEYAERLGFLKYHSGDSTIDLYVCIFGGDQQVPEDVKMDEYMSRYFSQGRPAVVVHYFMGEPSRSAMYLSPKLEERVPATEKNRTLESSVVQASKELGALNQLHKFIVQMTIRIYWMENLLGAVPHVDSGLSDHPVSPQKVSESSAKSQLLAKVVVLYQIWVEPYLLSGGCVIWVLLTGMAIRMWVVRRAQYRFPEFDVEPRLGGSHAAGVGAVLSYASAALPPASQRDQSLDYLKRG